VPATVRWGWAKEVCAMMPMAVRINNSFFISLRRDKLSNSFFFRVYTFFFFIITSQNKAIV
jgi:hypothetical protein